MVFNRIKNDSICQYVSLFAIKEMKPARSDQSTLSFGRRLNKAEQELTAAKAEIKDLRDNLPEGQQLQAAAAMIEDHQRRSARLVRTQAPARESLPPSTRQRCAPPAGRSEVDGFYWTGLVPDIVNSGREEQGSVLV